jgi:hypothetical protein
MSDPNGSNFTAPIVRTTASVDVANVSKSIIISVKAI